MEKFTTHRGLAVPLDRSNVDTDQIIPKQYLRSIHRTGFGPYLFDDWRYLETGDLSTDLSRRRVNGEFVLNREEYRGGSVLLARDNFGCGSSREHAVWALLEHGFRVVVAPSFGDIFAGNSAKNGLLLATVAAEDTDRLFREAEGAGPLWLTADLERRTLATDGGREVPFAIDDASRTRLLEGLDDITLTLRHRDAIADYERRRREQEPWLFKEQGG